MAKILKDPKIKLGRGYSIDENVIVGYLPSRKVKNDKLVIGVQAKIRSGTVIYLGSTIGSNLQTGHNVVIREENKIGNDFAIWNNSTIDYGCKIGNNAKIHCNCYIAQFSILEDDVFLAPGVTFANDMHPGCKFSHDCLRGPTVKKGARIGVKTTILPYVVIGEKSLIGSGSVVTRDIPAESVAYGNPARVHGSIYDLKCISKLTNKPFKK